MLVGPTIVEVIRWLVANIMRILGDFWEILGGLIKVMDEKVTADSKQGAAADSKERGEAAFWFVRRCITGVIWSLSARWCAG